MAISRFCTAIITFLYGNNYYERYGGFSTPSRKWTLFWGTAIITFLYGNNYCERYGGFSTP